MAFFDLEQAILAYHAITDCLVLERSTPEGVVEPVAYIVAGERFDRTSLSTHLSDLLPASPLPHIVRVDALPVTDGGGFDEDALAAIPCLEPALCEKVAADLKRTAGVVDAVAGLLDRAPTVPYVHLHDLRSTVGLRVTESAEAPSGVSRSKGPDNERTAGSEAILDGGPLDPAPIHTVLELFERATTTWADRGLRYLDDDLRETFVSYEELRHGASRVLSGLRGTGASPGDRVILDLPDRDAFLTTFWACVLGGFVPVPVSGAATSGDSLELSEPLARTWEYLGRPLIVRGGRDRSGDPTSGTAGAGSDSLPKFGWFEDLREEEPSERFHQSSSDEPALIVMTSGSTGEPKGVVLSHGNIVAQAAGTHQLLGLTPADVFVNVMPLEHVGGIILTHIDAVLQGCSQIQVPTATLQSDPLQWLDAIHKWRGTVTWVPNFAIGLVLEKLSETGPRDWDLSCLRHLLNGSEPVVPSTTREFVKLMGRHGFEEDSMEPVWGMSETAAGVVYSRTYSLSTTSDEDPNTALGVPVPGLAVRIVDDEDSTLGRGEVGHVQVKGPAVSTTYYNRPDLKEEVFTEDGWFRTGDLGTISEDGLTLTGRAKDIIILNGVNYGSHEIESAVESLDGILPSFTAAVSVRTGASFSDHLAVFFSPKNREDGMGRDLLQRIQRQVVSRVGSRPEFLIPVDPDQIPKTGIGKIRRSALKDRFERGDFLEEVKRSDLLLRNGRVLSNRLFRKGWAKRLPRAFSPRSDGRSILVFVPCLDTERNVVAPLRERGWRCAVVHPGARFEALGDNRFSIQPDKPADYVALAEGLRDSGHRTGTTLHLWSMETPDPGEPGLDEQTLGALSLIRWIQAVNSLGPVENHRIVIGTTGVFPFGSSEPLDFRKGPLLGFSKAFPIEFPGSESRIVDLGGLDGASLGSTLAAEVEWVAGEDEVRHADGFRWTRTLERLDIPPDRWTPNPFETGGRYVILGGSGPIGQELSRRIRQMYGAQLLWVGRRDVRDAEVDLDRHGLPGAINEGGDGNIAYVSVDIGNPEDLARAVDEAEARWGKPVDAILHVADDAEPQEILRVNERAFRAGLTAKVDGMAAVSRVLEDRPGCHFLGFSSVVSFLGGAGLATYAGANASLEIATAALASSEGVTRTTVAWPPLRTAPRLDQGWERTFEANPRFFESTESMTPARAWDYLMAILQTGERNVLAGLDESSPAVRRFSPGPDILAEELKAFYRSEELEPASSIPIHMDLVDRFGVSVPVSITPVSELPDLLPGFRFSPTQDRNGSEGRFVAPRSSLERRLSELWAVVLKLDRVGIEDHFFDLGGNSLIATQLVSRIRTAFDVDLSLRSVFAAPTVEALSLEILERQATSLETQDLGDLLAIIEGET